MKKLFLILLLFSGLISPLETESANIQEDPDSLIITALSMVNEDSLHSYVQHLQNMGTRFMVAPNRKEVATWIMEKFLSFGLTEVRLDSFPAYVHINAFELNYDTTTWQYNVEAKITGTEFPEKEMILVGHYDDATQNVDPIFAAPGADDNASGTAALLESARVIIELGYQPGQTIVFLASAAEELMYYGDAGTEHYALEAQNAGRDIVMAVNNDMIAWNDGSNTIQLFNHTGSPEITALAKEIINNYTTLNYQSHTPVQDVGGDIQPFLDAGYHGIYFMEHSINPHYHTLGDTIGNLDFAYFAETTGIGLGCILQKDITVKTRDYPMSSNSLVIIPNPASGYVMVHTPEKADLNHIEIFSLDGTLQLSQTLSGPTRIDISSLPAGVYILAVRNKEKCNYGKLVVI